MKITGINSKITEKLPVRLNSEIWLKFISEKINPEYQYLIFYDFSSTAAIHDL